MQKFVAAGGILGTAFGFRLMIVSMAGGTLVGQGHTPSFMPVMSNAGNSFPCLEAAASGGLETIRF
jgi:hypothetical protein